MQIEITGKERYAFEHGHRPSGHGTWAFQIAGLTEPFFYNGTFTDACAAARNKARELGATTARILP